MELQLFLGTGVWLVHAFACPVADLAAASALCAKLQEIYMDLRALVGELDWVLALPLALAVPS